jgi:PAS domain-containing protein
MAQHGIETILMRRLASRLTMPILLVDPRGDLVYFNEAAGLVLGERFEDTGGFVRGQWSTRLQITAVDGSAISREELPLFIATEHRVPCHRRFRIHGLDGVDRELESIAFPLIGQGQRMLGAVGVFWDRRAPPKPGVPPVSGSFNLASPGGDRPVELLLMRQLASYLSAVIFLIGADGAPLFYNEPAERLIGRRFEEDDEMSAEQWTGMLPSTDETGSPIPFEQRPLIVALQRQEPSHQRFRIRGFDHVEHPIVGLGFPLVSLEGRQLGAVGIFWERTGA